MDLLITNMEVLEKNKSRFAALLPSQWEGDGFVCTADSGSPTLLVQNPAEQKYFLHSPRDPVEEASTLLDGRHFHDRDVTVLLGFGLGYLAKAIRERMGPCHDLILIENRPDIFLAAMKSMDLGDLFSDPRVRFCVGIESDAVIQTLAEIKGKLVSGRVQKLSYGPAVDLAPEAYAALEKEIETYVSELKSSLQSFKIQIPIRTSNLFNNLASLSASSSSTALKNAFPGLPAVVVSAGPSLDKNIRIIGKALGKAPVIAVDAALKPLLASGITPDVIATLDPLEKNFEKFSGLLPNQLKDVGLVFAPEGNPRIPKLFPGPRFFINSHNTFTDWLIGHFGALPDFSPMYTVSHLAFFIARHMGCDPIILAGFDFSFPGDRDHSRDCAETWRPNFEKWSFIEIEDVHGGKVKTFSQFLRMLRLLEREINKTQAFCIDATEGGARINGTKSLSLEKAIITYVPKERTEIGLRLKEISVAPLVSGGGDIRGALRWLDSEIRHACEIIQSADAMIAQTRQSHVFHRPEGIRILSSLGELKRQITGRTVFIDILGDLLSDLLIHETRSAPKTTPRSSSAKKEIPERIADYEYFFSELNKILILLSENYRDHLNPCPGEPKSCDTEHPMK